MSLNISHYNFVNLCNLAMNIMLSFNLNFCFPLHLCFSCLNIFFFSVKHLFVFFAHLISKELAFLLLWRIFKLFITALMFAKCQVCKMKDWFLFCVIKTIMPSILMLNNLLSKLTAGRVMQTYAHQHKDVEGMCATNVHVLCTVGGGKELPVTGFHLKTCHFFVK